MHYLLLLVPPIGIAVVMASVGYKLGVIVGYEIVKRCS